MAIRIKFLLPFVFLFCFVSFLVFFSSSVDWLMLHQTWTLQQRQQKSLCKTICDVSLRIKIQRFLLSWKKIMEKMYRSNNNRKCRQHVRSGTHINLRHVTFLQNERALVADHHSKFKAVVSRPRNLRPPKLSTDLVFHQIERVLMAPKIIWGHNFSLPFLVEEDFPHFGGLQKQIASGPQNY